MAAPPTPPSTNPDSPQGPPSFINDAIINIDSDIEKQECIDEKRSYLNGGASLQDDSPDCQESKLFST